MLTPTIKKDNFIWVADGYIPDAECDKALDLYKKREEQKLTFNRLSTEGATGNIKKDEAISFNHLDEGITDEWHNYLKPLFINLNTVIRMYENEYDLPKMAAGRTLEYTSAKIQKTVPGGGYHIWHIEQDSCDLVTALRRLVYIVYLNDIEEGGETEFLHFSSRVKPKKGRIVVWPAGFPYVHRGNPPLKGTKFILTSWLLNTIPGI